MKKRMIFPCKAAVILLCGIIIGFVLLLAVYALPTAPMANHVLASVPAFNGEWAREESYETLVPGYRGTQLDNSTDAAMLLHAVYEGNESLVERVADGRVYSMNGNGFASLLTYGLNEGSSGMPSPSIARYWHGYLVFLKPLLCFLSYLDIRMLLTIVQGFMMAAVIAGLCRRKLGRYLPAFLLSLLCITPSAAGFSMQFSTVFCTFLLAMIALLYLPAKWFKGQNLGVFFLLIGMFTSYVDYLTYPLASFGMPFVLCVVLDPRQSAKEEWKRLLFCGICWVIGYLGMWAGKWVIAGAFGSDPWFWANLFAKIGERSSDVAADTTLSYLTVLKENLSVFFKRAYLLAGAAAACTWFAALLKGKKSGSAFGSPSFFTVLIAVALTPFAWYFCTQNHSYIHAFFTSRNLAVTVFSICCLFTSILPKNLYKSNDL